jgi:hypothetical protein
MRPGRRDGRGVARGADQIRLTGTSPGRIQVPAPRFLDQAVMDRPLRDPGAERLCEAGAFRARGYVVGVLVGGTTTSHSPRLRVATRSRRLGSRNNRSTARAFGRSTPKSDQWPPTSWLYTPRSHATQMRLGFDGPTTMALTGEVGRSPDLSIQCAPPSTERKTEPGMVE